MRMHLPALLGAGALLLAGCGGSSSSPPAYAAAADAICGAQLAQLNRLPQPASPEAALAYLPRALAIMERERTGLSRLAPPARPYSEFAAALMSQGRLAALLRHVLHQLRSGVVDVGVFARVQTESDALSADIKDHFRRAGVARCAA